MKVELTQFYILFYELDITRYILSNTFDWSSLDSLQSAIYVVIGIDWVGSDGGVYMNLHRRRKIYLFLPILIAGVRGDKRLHVWRTRNE